MLAVACGAGDAATKGMYDGDCHPSDAPAEGIGALDGEVRELDEVGSMVELPNGKVLMIETAGQKRTLKLLDFATGEATQLGTHGGGPREYESLGGLLPGRGDTVWVSDYGNQRFLIVTPDGTLRDTVVAFGEHAVGLVGGMDGYANASDSLGRLYSTRRVRGIDSMNVSRWDPATGRTDSVTRYGLHPPKEIGRTESKPDASGAGSMTMTLEVSPYDGSDDWVVFRDGTVMVVGVTPYRAYVHRADGTRLIGDPIPYTPIPLPEAEAKRLGYANKPPFLSTFFSVRAAPNGTVWVRRAMVDDNAPSELDIFDQSAKVVGHARLPACMALEGFGRSHLFLSKETPDGVVVQRYTMR